MNDLNSPPAAEHHLQSNPDCREAARTSDTRARAARENGKKSQGPKTKEGKSRSCLNATRHGILSQTIHLPEEEMKAYSEFARKYVQSLAPVGEVELQLANACADLQFRLHRVAAAEHNLFALGHEENGDRWGLGVAQAIDAVVRSPEKSENTRVSESHTALTLVETFRRSKDPLALLAIYEQRLNRRFLQTLKQLREIQAERRELEQQQLAQMYSIALQHPQQARRIVPADLGFVCSNHDWALFRARQDLLGPGNNPTRSFLHVAPSTKNAPPWPKSQPEA